MPGDTYMQPAFAWLHAARKAGSANLTLPEAITAATPKAWLLDGRGTRRVVWSASGTKQIRLDRGAAAREQIDTLIIPPGHNLEGHRVRINYDSNHDGLWSATGNIIWYSRLRSAAGALIGTPSINVANRTIHAGLNVFRFVANSYRYVEIDIETRATNVPELGEFWLSRSWTPTFGLEPDYADTLEPNVSLTTLVGGGMESTENGAARRVWELKTTGVYGEDARIYDRLLVETGVTRDPWLLEPPGSGGYETTLELATSTTGWSSSTATLGTSSSNRWLAATDYLTATTTANPARVFKALDSDVDLRGKLLVVAIKLTSTAGMTATDGIRVIPYQDGTTTVSYAFGTNHIASTGQWYQLFVDVEEDTPVSHSTTGFDPWRMEGIAIDAIMTAGVEIGISDIHTIDKVRAPLIVRTLRAAKATNTSSNPSGSGERRSFALQVMEAIE